VYTEPDGWAFWANSCAARVFSKSMLQEPNKVAAQRATTADNKRVGVDMAKTLSAHH